MFDQPLAPDHPPPGALPGGALGVAAGLLLGLIWLYGAWDVALAVSAVFAGLVAVLFASSAPWRPFATALVAAAGVTFGVLFLLVS
ncbi:hypothetical protein [Nocardioides conyzicola]|uniref:DUF2537 domain-containing protein n=1 Tax=Nocardioides conyzicola TaxID=1651781 RepID=A0ABP8Y015_9ACTN